MKNYTWEHCSVHDVSYNGGNYLYSLVCDYERYLKDFGFITLDEFIKDWKCVTYKAYSELQIGDFVYSPHGLRYKVMDTPYESDDETCLYMEVAPEREDGSFDESGKSNEVIQDGDVYSENVIHDHYRWKKKINRGEERVCPILITKTNQPQS